MIPKTIHQYWANDTPFSDEYRAYAESWQIKNPEWQYVRWTDQTMFPLYNQEKYMWTLDDPDRTNIFRSVLVRFEILHRYGGIWFAPQMEALNPLDLDLSVSSFVVDGSADVVGSEANASFLWETIVALKQDQHCLNNGSLAEWHLHHSLKSHLDVVRMPVCKFFPHDKKGNVRCDLSQALTTYHW